MDGGWVTTHVLDTGLGVPAAGLRIEVWRIEGTDRRRLREVITNDDGRPDGPAIAKGELEPGVWELVFQAGEYFAASSQKTGTPRFLDVIPIRFGIERADEHYHVPLLLAPYGYSTYRGS